MQRDTRGETSEMGRRASLGVTHGAAGGSEGNIASILPGSISQTSLQRRASDDQFADPNSLSPSSAPATPRVTGVTHPSQFIHTHHPRRTSLTPLGLNVISPVPPHSPLAGPSTAPPTAPPPAPTRKLGFSPAPGQHSPKSGPSPLTGILPIDTENLSTTRRGSGNSSSSTLTQTRPSNSTSPSSSAQHLHLHPHAPPKFGAGSIAPNDRRRSSLTPSGAAISAASPTRRHVVGRQSRPTTSDGNPKLHARGQTEAVTAKQRLLSSGQGLIPDYARRGSMPQLNYAGWTRYPNSLHNNYNVLPPPRGSVDDSPTPKINDSTPTANAPRFSPALPDASFKFGTIDPNAAGSKMSSTSSLDLASSSPHFMAYGSRSPKQKEKMDVFQQAEAAEADRQWKAFFAATYGEDGRKARQRLSIGTVVPASGTVTGTSSPMGQSVSNPTASAAVPGPSMLPGPTAALGGSHLRRQSLVLWEKMQAASRTLDNQADLGQGIVTSLPPVDSIGPLDGGEGDGRRGSLPVDIPGAMARRVSQLTGLGDAEEPEKFDVMNEEDEQDPNAETMSRRSTLRAISRPLPPLLPLSDPGPRLLPSTLALHRANHLLSSRNLQAEPLPHPLPPSLHPPAPVDLAEFDIDFILSGSSAQLGGSADDKRRNLPTDVLTSKAVANMPVTPTLNLAGTEGEDTFAKFVGDFDDEYGGRRGEWTFRACPPPVNVIPASSPGGPTSSILERSGSAQSTYSSGSGRDPLDTSGGYRGPLKPKAEWDSIEAGKYELYSNGEIKSIQTGSVWRVRKTGSREYELDRITPSRNSQEKMGGTTSTIGDAAGSKCPGRFYLTTRVGHCENGGIKTASMADTVDVSRSSSASNTTSRSSTGQLEVDPSSRGTRLGSADSAATIAKSSLISSSLPLATSPSRIEDLRPGAVPPPNEGVGRGRIGDAFASGRPAPPPVSLSRHGTTHGSQSGERRISDAGVKESGKSREKDTLGAAKSLGGKIKRALKATVNAGSGSGSTSSSGAEEKRAQRERWEERERERAQSQTWSPSTSHAESTSAQGSGSYTHSHLYSPPRHQAGHGQGHSYTQSVGRGMIARTTAPPPQVPLSTSGTSYGSSSGGGKFDSNDKDSQSHSHSSFTTAETGTGSATGTTGTTMGTSPSSSGLEHRMGTKSSTASPRTGVRTIGSNQHHQQYTQQQLFKDEDYGEGWINVPDEAVAMAIPVCDASHYRPSTATAVKVEDRTGGDPTTTGQRTAPPPAMSGKQVMLIWYVPFNSGDGEDTRPTTAGSTSTISSISHSHSYGSTQASYREREEAARPIMDVPRSRDRDGRSDSSHSTHGQAHSQGQGQSQGQGLTSGSLPKFQKLLKRRTSKEKEALRREKEREREREREKDKDKYDSSSILASGGGGSSWPPTSGAMEPQGSSMTSTTGSSFPVSSTSGGTSYNNLNPFDQPRSGSGYGHGYGSGHVSHPADLTYPLPFRSFRVVGRVVPMDDLRSKVSPSLLSLDPPPSVSGRTAASGDPALDSPISSLSASVTPPVSDALATFPDDTTPPAVSGPGTGARAASASASTPIPTPYGTQPNPRIAITSSSVPEPPITSSTTSPIVLAVCHSRSSGVEFVLEGLDRLGLCRGESAWGPTGYEEWRGAGLSDKGREVLDLIWAGCVGVMGLLGH